MAYQIEDYDVGTPTPNIPGLLNRDYSEGRFGIGGHDIEDLAYNGYSDVRLFEGDSENFIVCRFSVDS
jgi:hypothetical protein